MKNLFILLGCFLLSSVAVAQTVGSTKTEQYKTSFETKIDISQYLDYDGPTIPIQILKCGIGDDLYESYPELKEKKEKMMAMVHRIFSRRLLLLFTADSIVRPTLPYATTSAANMNENRKKRKNAGHKQKHTFSNRFIPLLQSGCCSS